MTYYENVIVLKTSNQEFMLYEENHYTTDLLFDCFENVIWRRNAEFSHIPVFALSSKDAFDCSVTRFWEY